MSKHRPSSIAHDEVAQFSRHAEDWWNPDGVFRPLHRLNPVRLTYIRERACTRFRRNPDIRHSLRNLTILDVGCGGGLLTEPLARMGAEVTGLDASKESIAIARTHVKETGLAIDYRTGSVEDLACGKTRYDIITALEIVEHVADLDAFIKPIARLLKPGGLLIMSTLNRTPKSFLLGIVAAEYVLRWVPRGTHQWGKFLRPSELVRHLELSGIRTTDLTGLVFNPMRDEFELSARDLDVNYMLAAVRDPQLRG
jgi:2-polyprenyl-6-hydroxyphenyl methylase/3-demethylubiquinone-9 3-methyltransferase